MLLRVVDEQEAGSLADHSEEVARREISEGGLAFFFEMMVAIEIG